MTRVTGLLGWFPQVMDWPPGCRLWVTPVLLYSVWHCPFGYLVSQVRNSIHVGTQDTSLTWQVLARPDQVTSCFHGEEGV